MSKLISKLTILLVLFALLVYVYCRLASTVAVKYYGENIEEQIRKSFKNSIKDDYNCYFLGNSRIYRNINPELFDSVNAYNFGHDNDTYNQMYYKLLYLINNGEKIEYLIIGTDYFQFSYLADARNYVYVDLLPSEYLADYPDSSTKVARRLDRIKRLWISKQNAFTALLNYAMGNPPPNNIPYQKDNGQYCVEGTAKGDETIQFDFSIMDIQYDYFKRIIELCVDENIDLYVVMPPLWEAMVESGTDEEFDKFNKMIIDSLKDTPYENQYINYCILNGLSSYEDFSDATHLSPEVADTYSGYLNHYIFE